MKNLNYLDFIIIAIWLATTFGIIFFKRINKMGSKVSSTDYILMGRKLTLPLFIATLVSSWYGGIFGVTQIAFEHGIYNLITQGIFWYIAYFIFAFFLIKKIYQNGAITFPELIKRIYGNNAAKLTAVLLIFKAIPITYAMSLGALINILFDIDYVYALIIGTSIVIIYTSLGDFKTIVYSDFIQFCCMYLSVLLVICFAHLKIGGIKILYENLPHHYFSMNGKHTFSTTFLWLFIAFSATLVSPVFYQRCMAADSERTARKGIIISTFFWMIFDICTTMGGMYAKVYMPEENSLNAYLLFALEILPQGVRGIFLSGIIATIISTLDSFIFVTSTLLSHDLIKIKFINLSIIRRGSIIFTGLITIIFALLFEGMIEKVWLTFESYFGALLIIPIIWSYFIKIKISDNEFISASSISFLTMIIKDIIFNDIEIETFYLGCVATLICYVCFSIKKINISLKLYKRYGLQLPQK